MPSQLLHFLHANPIPIYPIVIRTQTLPPLPNGNQAPTITNSSFREANPSLYIKTSLIARNNQQNHRTKRLKNEKQVLHEKTPSRDIFCLRIIHLHPLFIRLQYLIRENPVLAHEIPVSNVHITDQITQERSINTKAAWRNHSYLERRMCENNSPDRISVLPSPDCV